MSPLAPDAVADWLARQRAVLAQTPLRAEAGEIGRVLQIADGIARVAGLPGVRLDELVRFADDSLGFALSLDSEYLSVVLLDDGRHIAAGSEVRGTGEVLQVPVGPGLLGRVVDPLGRPLRRPPAPLDRRAQEDGPGAPSPALPDEESDVLPALELCLELAEFVLAVDRLAVDLQDDVALAQAGVFGERARLHLRDDHALVGGNVEPRGHVRSDVLHRHSELGVLGLGVARLFVLVAGAVAEQLGTIGDGDAGRLRRALPAPGRACIDPVGVGRAAQARRTCPRVSQPIP